MANHHAPFGFRGTLEHLNESLGTNSTRRWTEQELLAALDELGTRERPTCATAISSLRADVPRRRTGCGARRGAIWKH